MNMPTYEYNKEYAKKYIGKLDEIKIRMPKGRKTDVERYALSKGLSVNALVNQMLQEAMGMSDDEWKRPEQAVEGGT